VAAAGTVAAVPSAPLAYEWEDTVVLHGHTGWVQSLALLPGGRLASGDWNGTVRLWDVARGREAAAALGGHHGIVFSLAALPDGRRFAAGVFESCDKMGAIVVSDTGAVPPAGGLAIKCDSTVLAMAVLADGRLAAGCSDGGVRLVEVREGASAVSVTLEGHKGCVYALTVLPDGTLASGAWDTTVRLWNVGAPGGPARVATLVGHKKQVKALAVLADGRLASGSDDMTVRLWDVATRTCVAVLKGHTHYVNALAALSDGRLASASWDGTIRVWDTRPAGIIAGGIGASILALGKRVIPGATPVVVLEGHTGVVYALVALPGGRLASGSADDTVRLWCLPPL